MARIPITTSLGIDTFAGGSLSVLSSGVINAIYGKHPDGRVYATQRPSVNIYEDASATVADAAGRGIYYWAAVGSRYFVNSDTVYKGSYSAPLGVTMTAGTERVYFFEVGAYLVILDPENNEGWYISSGASTTLVAISDTDFPPEQTPALQLAKGGAVLNGALYVMATNGEIFGSDTEDPTSWGALNFLTAEINPDPGVYLTDHGQNIAAFGTRTIEFFYDAANATGSPLSPRTDVEHDVGTIDHNTVWNDGTRIFFVNLNPSGDMNVSVLQNFQLQKISNTDIDTFITSSVITDSLMMNGSGFTSGGHSYYILTIYYVSGVVVPLTSLVFDATQGTWSRWELMHTGIDDFPLMDLTRSNATLAGDGILSNGDIVTIADDKNPQDSTEAQIYVVADYVDPGYISDTGSTGTAIDMTIITGPEDFGTRNYKHADNLRAVINPTTASEDLTIQWSDQGNDNYNTGRTLDLSNHNNKLTRCGRFRTRNHKITYSGDEQIEIEALEMDIT
jgi:hypothetical protein